MFRCSSLSSRSQLSRMLNDMGLVGEAAEIGTHRGEFSYYGIMNEWKGKRLWCVDPWEVLPGYEEQAKLLWGGAPSEPVDHFEAAKSLLHKYGDRVQLIRSTSILALPEFADKSLDFVYLDGDHQCASVYRDLRGWWEKIKPGGVLAGHDFVQPGESHRWAGEVQTALSEFLGWLSGACSISIDVQLIVEEGGLPWSYYMVKPM